MDGDVDVVAAHIATLIKETRKKDLLEGSVRVPRDILEAPFERDPHWTKPWQEAHDPATGALTAPVLVIVAPRSIGSTTFALRLLAEHATRATTVLKLDPDWHLPSIGRLPLEPDHSFQIDLKDPEHDRVTDDFLDRLPEYADHLRGCRSRLVLTVAQELWADHRVTPRRGVHVIRLQDAPDAFSLVKAHLEAHGYTALVASLRTFAKARDSLKGLNAVRAARAVHTIVAAWQEHQHRLNSPTVQAGEPEGAPPSLEERVTAALTDWRGELDGLFGEAPAVHSPKESSLTVEDRCLLLALAVQQSAPMPEVARTADRLLNRLGEAPAPHGEAAVARGAFAGRGTRRRVHDVGASVDGQDNVVFDRPAYGRAVLEYVWDNYDALREHLLAWLLETASDSTDELDEDQQAVQALAHLTVRHGSREYLTDLGKSAPTHPEVLSAVMEIAVGDEHIGPLVWDTLYRWAASESSAGAVISLCRRVLRNSPSPAAAKRAMVRLRRVAHKVTGDAARDAVLKVFDELAHRSSGTPRLVTEVRGWQEKKTSARSGHLAFLALMTAPTHGPGVPWLVRTADKTGIDVPAAIHDLLVDPHSKERITPRLVSWIGSCSGDETAYSHLRDTVLPALRSHGMLKAGMELMRSLEGVSTARGDSVAEDFYQHLVDPRLQSTFPLADKSEDMDDDKGEGEAAA